MMEVVRSSLARVAPLPIAEATRELVRIMIEAHRLDPKLHRVLVEQIPRVGALERIEAMDEQACVMVRAYLEAHRDEVGVDDLDMASFLAVTSVEAMTHMAVLRRPELLDDERFIDEVAALVVRYLRGEVAASSSKKPVMLAVR
jgi:hypothetical protein